MTALIYARKHVTECVAAAILYGWLLLGLAFFWVMPRALSGDHFWAGILGVLGFMGALLLYAGWRMAKDSKDSRDIWAFWLLSMVGSIFFWMAVELGVKLMAITIIDGIVLTGLMSLFAYWLVYRRWGK